MNTTNSKPKEKIFKQFIPNVYTVELTESSRDISTTFEYLQQQQFLPMDQAVSLESVIGTGESFSIDLELSGVPALELALDKGGNPEISGTSQWSQKSANTFEFMLPLGAEQFSMSINLTAENETTVSIIIVGTVPTTDD